MLVQVRDSLPFRLPLGASVREGVWRLVDSPPVSTTYRIAAPSGRPVAVRRVLVRPRIELYRVRSQRRPTILVRAVAYRSLAGRLIAVQRRVGGQWRTEQTARLARGSSARVVLRDATQPLRVVLPKRDVTSEYLAGISRAVSPSALLPREEPPNASRPETRADLEEALRLNDVPMCFQSREPDGLFGQASHLYVSPGGLVIVRQFPDEAAAQEAASRISGDGHNIELPNRQGIVHIDWIGPPHWYRAGRVLVLYLGDHAPTLRVLTRVLGRQFAGR